MTYRTASGSTFELESDILAEADGGLWVRDPGNGQPVFARARYFVDEFPT